MNMIETEQALSSIDWQDVRANLSNLGYSVIGPLLSPSACQQLIELFGQKRLFRKQVDMGSQGYGRGEYSYFDYPLPEPVSLLRTQLYGPLAEIANDWNRLLGKEHAFPQKLDDYLQECHQAGQRQPTPLLLKYGPGDFNCLHQDIYGQHVFPLQVVILLARPNEDFTGGEFILTEQSADQPRVEVADWQQGQALIFPVHERPIVKQAAEAVEDSVVCARMMHGVARLRSGSRFTLGLIFHDAA